MNQSPILWNGQQYDSDEEVYFAYWCEELRSHGIIHTWTREVSAYKLTNGLYHHYTEIKQLKTKTKAEIKKQTLLLPSYYTPDFQIEWAEGGREVVYDYMHTDIKITRPLIAQGFGALYQSTVEIKPKWDYKNMTRGFINNQKFMWERYGVYVNLIHTEDLFEETFTPELFGFTKTGLKRKITKWKPRTLKQFLDDSTRKC